MAEALLAFRDGGDSPQAFAGAMLLAGGLADLEACAQFAVSYAKWMAKGG